MEPLIETIDLDMEESNELAFKLKVEGTANSPAKVRLVCEGSDVSYMFNGRGTPEEGVVQFVMPQMKDKLAEGIYQARVEVLIENRYFSPVQFQINFKKAVKVVAEALFVTPKASKPEISVSASPIIVSKPAQQAKPIVVQQASQSVVQQQKNMVENVKPRQDKQVTETRTSVSSLKDRYLQKRERPLSESTEIDQSVIEEIARALKIKR